MRIYQMTATFGKLENETLTLEPGLNIIEAPNEWGKSTWCAFLLAMLYGLDTRAKSTRTTLADKERFAPWSGVPMSGRINLNWNGRDITIERSSKGRVPMGVFRAYETKSGLDVQELTAANCGAVLLGVEQSVFRRAGFIRQSDMPVTQDDALRRRLNDLVTTGDESGDGEKLARELKELKNKCRYNRTGLIPQAELQRHELEEKINERYTLEVHSRKLKERLGEIKTSTQVLENHLKALEYAEAEADASRVAEARVLRDRAEAEVVSLEEICAKQPAKEEVERKIRAIEAYREDYAAAQLEEAEMQAQPLPPVPPELFRGMKLQQAGDMVAEDCQRYALLTQKKPWLAYYVLAWLSLLLAFPLAFMEVYWGAAAAVAVGLAFGILGMRKQKSWRRETEMLEEKYGSAYPEAWQMLFTAYEEEQRNYEQALLDYRVFRGDLDIQHTFLQKQRESLFGGQSPEKVLEIWLKMQKNWESYQQACREYQRAEKYLNTLQEMANPPVDPPAMEDHLTYSTEETERLLNEARAEQQRLQNRLGQYQGRMEALGDGDGLKEELQTVEQRITKLEEIYAATTIALDTLAQARQELQRRFAPRISKRAQELLGAMTAGRYDRLSFSEDLSLLAGAQQESVLHEALWRSEGTVDQLYLALRLAVAEELTPEAPLVLDDAFVRFDNDRLRSALEILKQEAEQKQVILFTCQDREKRFCAE
ncbi:MAG: AAA family ATPase [Oscillospiraceae bacterium]|nr:AAA family ATPase [Oscillospiraceae bacterium]